MDRKAKPRAIVGRKATDPEPVEGSPGCRSRNKRNRVHVAKTRNPVFLFPLSSLSPGERACLPQAGIKVRGKRG